MPTKYQIHKFRNDNRLSCVEQSVRDLQNQATDSHDKVKLLQYKSIDSEARSRHSNLVFRGLTEEVGEDSMAVLQPFLLDKLDLDPDTVHSKSTSCWAIPAPSR